MEVSVLDGADRPSRPRHDAVAFYYAISRMLERASYYGFRALLVLYMVGETLKMEYTEALSIYGWLAVSMLLAQIIGAVLGDLLVGNRRAILIGGIMQALGILSLCIPSGIGLYLGLFLIVLGNGFYSPNLIANFGKLYLNKTRLLDAGFSLFYLAVNLGSFLGVLLIGYSGEKYGYRIGFLIAAILSFLSILPILLSKYPSISTRLDSEPKMGKRILNIAIVLIAVGIFWGLYEIAGFKINHTQLKFSELAVWELSQNMWQSINASFTLFIGLIATILWTYFYSSQIFKLMLGFVFGTIALGVLHLVPEAPMEQHTLIYLLALFLLGISEIYIAPIIHSTLTQYANPKYLAILISLYFIPNRAISMIFGLFNQTFFENPNLGLQVGMVAMAAMGLLLLLYVYWNKRQQKEA
ncbi:MAG: MFS transporter [Bacteroidota bacterium]